MPIPVCFMVMPFGKKTTNAEAGKGPAEIDFDALWDKALRPMIQDLNYLPIRADQDAGSLIIQAMIERLAISDLVIADLTIPNANVYYEVGVRHAAQRQGCVMIAADWSKPLFDMAQMRRLTFSLTDGSIPDDVAAAIRKNLKERIGQAIDLTSPVFQAIPGYPDRVDPSQLQSFRDVAERLAAFQGEVSVARGLPPAQAATEVKKLLDTYTQDAAAVPSVALDLVRLLRDLNDWSALLQFIDGLPPRLRQLPILREQHALALGKTGEDLKAIAELDALIRIEGDTSERSGLIGGRYKSLFEHAPDAPTKSNYLNKAIQSYERGMMLDLNDYYPSCNLPRLYRQRKQGGDEKKASDVATVALAACERARKRNPQDPWIIPTLLGAAIDAGDIASAQRLLDEITQAGAAPFHVRSTAPDLRRALLLLQDVETSSALASILGDFQRLRDANGTVVALAGRRIDAENATERRFPPENETVVAQRIHNMLVASASRRLVCSAACGADILALESAGQLGLSRRIILPFARDRFRATSVADRGESWGVRFDAILKQLAPEDIVELEAQGSDNDAYAAANARIVSEAISLASTQDRYALAAMVWNGLARSSTDMTDSFRQLAAKEKLEIITVPTL